MVNPYHIPDDEVARNLVENAKRRLFYELERVVRHEFPQFNPATSIQYTQDWRISVPLGGPRSSPVAVREPKPGWKAKVWRVLGELFDRRDWRNRGVKFTSNLILLSPDMLSLDWKTMGYMQRVNLPYIESFNMDAVLRCAYDPLHDVLYIQRRP